MFPEKSTNWFFVSDEQSETQTYSIDDTMIQAADRHIWKAVISKCLPFLLYK